MKLTPTKILVHHAEDSTSTPPTETWLNYWEDNMSISFSNTKKIQCHCCEKEYQRSEMVGAHVTCYKGTFIYPTCRYCNDTYKNSKALEREFWAFINSLCPLPQDNLSDK